MKNMPRMIAIALVGAVALVALALFFVRSAGNISSTPPHADAHEESDSVVMSDEKIKAAGIELVATGPGEIKSKVKISGVLQPDQENLVTITPRFPGVVREARVRVGDKVKKGDTLALIESNQSLTVYELKAPIDGTIIERNVALGEYASEQKAAFVVADLSQVWADFSVHRRDLSKVRVGDPVSVDPEDGNPPVEVKITYVAPVGLSDTQSALVRAVIPNADLRFRPGLFVSGIVVSSAKKVPLFVRSSALQTLENRTVVFVRNGEKFEAREVELGPSDGENVEILFGLIDGDLYAAKNSFVIKAEIGKATAEHAH